MKTIVHISADFPDAMKAGKTAVVRRLVDGTTGYRHRVYSLNRVDGLGGLSHLPFGHDRIALAYGAPPKGILLETRLRAVARWIAADLARESIRPDLFHAHKLTVEGIIVDELTATTPCPYLVTSQGDTDLRIIGVRRDLKPLFRRIATGAAALLPLAPWTRAGLAQHLGLDAGSMTLLPCLLEDDRQSPAAPVAAPVLATVFHLQSARRKNLDSMAKAALTVTQTHVDFRLDVHGGGEPGDVMTARRMIAEAGAEHVVRLCGPTREPLPTLLQRYAGLVLPTRRESYGLVHVEALLAGLPILWSRDRGIDGLFAAVGVGYRCDPADLQDIALGMRYLVDHEAAGKRAVAEAQGRGAFESMRRKTILDTYRAVLERALAGNGPKPTQGR